MTTLARQTTISVVLALVGLSLAAPAAAQCRLSNEEFNAATGALTQERIQDVRDAGLCQIASTAECFGEYRGNLQAGRSDAVRATIGTDNRGFIEVILTIGGESVTAQFFNASDFEASFPNAGVCIQATFFKGPCTLIGVWTSLENAGRRGTWAAECEACCPELFEDEDDDTCPQNAKALGCCENPPAIATWVGAGGGTFVDGERWLTSEVPDGDDHIFFNEKLVVSDAITFDRDVTNDSLHVGSDFVVFDLSENTYRLSQASGCFPALAAGSPPDPDLIDGSLIFQNGRVQAEDVVIGEQGDEVGAIELIDAVLSASGNCVAGKAGSGVLRVSHGEFSARDIIVGDETEAAGGFNVRDGGGASIQNLIVGNEPLSDGVVIIEGQRGRDSSFVQVAGKTEIGVSGVAELRLRNGGLMSCGADGDAPDESRTILAKGGFSVATVVVEGSEETQWQTQFLEVAQNGDADLLVRGGAKVFSATGLIGGGLEGSGGVTISRGSTWDIEQGLFVGFAGAGVVAVDEQSRVTTNTLHVGPRGTVDAARITVRSENPPPPERRINRAQSVNDEENGIVTRELIVEDGGAIAADVINRGKITAGPDDCTIGAMAVKADFTQEPEGVLRIKLGGNEPGLNHDVLRVDGRAALGGTLLVEAIDGFVPRPDQLFEIVTAGAIEGQFETIAGSGEYEVVYEDARALLRVVAAPSTVGPACSGSVPDGAGAPDCGAGACGAGVATMAPLMMLGLSVERTRRRHR